jgi:hypothetical protein
LFPARSKRRLLAFRKHRGPVQPREKLVAADGHGSPLAASEALLDPGLQQHLDDGARPPRTLPWQVDPLRLQHLQATQLVRVRVRWLARQHLV